MWQCPFDSERLDTQRDNGRCTLQPAVTGYRILAQDRGLAWLQLTPETGPYLCLTYRCP